MYLQLLQEMKNWTSHLAFQTSESSVQLILVFPSVLHLCAALTTQTRRVPDPDGHPCVRSYTPCRSVRDCFRPLPTTQLHRAPCGPPFPLLGLPHLHAALAIRPRRAVDHAGPIYNTSHPAEEACKTTCAASHPH